jgi:hypothetical protein
MPSFSNANPHNLFTGGLQNVVDRIAQYVVHRVPTVGLQQHALMLEEASKVGCCAVTAAAQGYFMFATLIPCKVCSPMVQTCCLSP